MQRLKVPAARRRAPASARVRARARAPARRGACAADSERPGADADAPGSEPEPESSEKPPPKKRGRQAIDHAPRWGSVHDDEAKAKAFAAAFEKANAANEKAIGAAEEEAIAAVATAATDAAFAAAPMSDALVADARNRQPDAKTYRNAALKDIAFRVVDAHMAARQALGVRKVYPKGKHMERDGKDNKFFLAVVERAAAKHVAGLFDQSELQKQARMHVGERLRAAPASDPAEAETEAPCRLAARVEAVRAATFGDGGIDSEEIPGMREFQLAHLQSYKIADTIYLQALCYMACC